MVACDSRQQVRSGDALEGGAGDQKGHGDRRLAVHATHPSWPPHERLWDFWRFSEECFQVLLNPVTGFEIVECSPGLPCSIVPFGHEEGMKGWCEQRANLGISVIAKRIGPNDRRLAWDVDVSEILGTTFPSSRPHGT